MSNSPKVSNEDDNGKQALLENKLYEEMLK